MSLIPAHIQETVAMLAMFEDRAERIQALISIGERFSAPDPAKHSKPYDENHRVPGCESQVFVWGEQRGKEWYFEFAVENPQGLSAMTMAVILQDGLNGLQSDKIQHVPEDIVYEIFGRELSMGKSMGLMNMLQVCKRISQG